ncbi:SRPBCC family protein [Nocardioides daejeonensis]|uniref:SRPBCC family protein n=1 Tax=Nocardioides daejeonensis TaxID=1046556 RepID=UPI000D74E265|nr:SRPBCC family protein [Nocardioides daejeonensis]
MTADRELVAETRIAASPEQVWAALTDFRRMARWSPETVRMQPLLRGGLRVGQCYLGVNRRGPVVWPTRNVVRVVRPAQELVWDTVTSGARWIYRLEADGAGTRLEVRRPVPRRLTRMSGLFAGALLGGVAAHADELEDGMRQTLERLRGEVESAVGEH